MKVLGRLLVGLLVVVVVAYGAVVAYMFFNQRALQYAPQGDVIALADTLLQGAEGVAIPVDDSVVNGWYRAPRAGKPLIVYFKGNTGSFTAEHERFERWSDEGYGFLAFDYRGFPTSPGAITQDHILADATAAFDWAAAQGFPTVIWGRSLGTGPASYVASIRETGALLLETPFLSAATVGAERYPILPVAWVMQDQFPSNQWIAGVAEPTLVAHGTADRTIDVSNGERLYQLVPNKDELWIEPGADHSDLWDRGIWEHAKGLFARAGLVAN